MGLRNRKSGPTGSWVAGALAEARRLIDIVAGADMARRHRGQRRRLGGAARGGEGGALAEAAAGGRIEQAGRPARDRDQLVAAIGEVGEGVAQAERIGVERRA